MKVLDRLTIIGHPNPYTGYGKHLIRAAHDIESITGTHIGIRCTKPAHRDCPEFIKQRILDPNEYDWSEWDLIIAPPTVCPTPKKRTAYFTMNETTALTPENVVVLNKADLVIVPNTWNLSVFRTSGVSQPMRVVPLGIDERIFQWMPLPKYPPVVFGTAGSGPRKGIMDVVKAFLMAFPDNKEVQLRIKITEADEWPDVFDDGRIFVLQSNVDDEGMLSWYANIHCFVSGSRGEGWGLMQQEAVACGRKLIILDDLGGMQEWLGGEPRESDLVDAPAPYAGQWLPGSVEKLSREMQMCFRWIGNRMIKTARAEEFTWDRSSYELINTLAVEKAIAEATPKIVETTGDCPCEQAGEKQHRKDCLYFNEPSPMYYHSGNLGDIIYGLYAIREHCDAKGARIVIGPSQFNSGPRALSKPVTKAQYDMLLPLLKVQPWIKSVRWTDHYPINEPGIDMNAFRKLWPKRHQMGIATLCEMQFELLGIRDKFDPEEAWLKIPESRVSHHFGRIVVHRSARWRQDAQMWQRLVLKHRPDLLFVGHADEYFDFENTFGTVSFWKVRDFCEMAILIADSMGFVGNQSFPCSLAIGLGQYVFQEMSLATPDCVFKRGHFWTQRDEIGKVMKEWMEVTW